MHPDLTEFYDFIKKNHEWLFSGIGPVILSAICGFLWWIFKKLSSESRKNFIVFLIGSSVGAILTLQILLAKKEIDSDANKITEAFKILFENKWTFQPYSDKNTHPCYRYQGKWGLDKNKYFLEINNGNGFIYYVSKSVDLYLWCQVGNDKGDMLEGLELLTNEVYFSDTQINPLIESKNRKFIGEMSGLFLDEIHFDLSQNNLFPIERTGRRIGRYHYFIPNDTTSEESILRNNIMNSVTRFLELLTNPRCQLNLYMTNTNLNLVKDESVMEFNCNYTPSTGNPLNYKKRVIYKGK